MEYKVDTTCGKIGPILLHKSLVFSQGTQVNADGCLLGHDELKPKKNEVTET